MPKEIRKILYLDVDIFVLKNIVELWETDLSNKTLLAVKDPHINKISSPEGLNYALRYYNLNPEAPYFNSGVLLLNLTKMLQDNFIEKCKKHLDNKNFRNNFWDQDVLNIFAYNDWLPLELKWNFPLPLLLTELNHSNNISINDGAHLVENNLVGIIHFTILKPTLGFPFHFYLIFWLFGNNRNINRIERRATFGFIFRFHYLYYLSLLKNNWVTPLKLSQEIIKYIISSFKNLFFRTPFEIWDLLKK
jgi:lipopolysaccharide biosynthesis glycosyltransferase